MNSLDYIREILTSLSQNKLRTLLTAFGVFWGMLFLVFLLGGGGGLQNGFKANFSSDLRDSIWIGRQHTSIPYAGLPANRAVEFTLDDVEAIKQQIPGIKYVSAETPLGHFFSGDIVFRYKGKSGVFGALGVADDYFKIKVYQDYVQGRRLNPLDSKERRKVTVIGTRIAEGLFSPGTNPVGKHIDINGVLFKVVGVFYDAGWNGRMSQRAYIPMTTFLKTFGDGRTVNLLTTAPKAGVDGFELEKKVVDLLKSRHKIAPDDPTALRVTNLLNETQRADALFLGIDIFVWFVGVGTLLAGIIGISNIMLISVRERTAEIGLRKAIGAGPGSIVLMILLETLFITAIAGYLGLAAGVGLLELLESGSLGALPSMIRNPSVDFGTATIALLVLIGSGVLAGLVPAWRAANTTPIDAIRQQEGG